MPSLGNLPPALLLILHHRHPLVHANPPHRPFGYQSDSRQSSSSARDVDPSSYAGAVRYDPLHHALYVTGATFGAGIFDGAEAPAPGDDAGRRQEGSGTASTPPSQEVGVPPYAPDKGDCFYAILGLPDGAEEKEARLLHARRFGSAGAQEACSALDVSFAPADDAVSLLLAGHVASPSRTAGYLADDLPAGERGAYAFAQRVDVGLPAAGAVTSGVAARAPLDVVPPAALDAVYPVALAADPTSPAHYYVALLATNDPDLRLGGGSGALNADPTVGAGASQGPGRPAYGRGYRIIVNKVALVDSDARAMSTVWMEEFEPDGGVDVRPGGLLYAPGAAADGSGDVLLLAGTTGGRGSAFGTTGGGPAAADDALPGDLDGFVTKILPDEGEFAGHDEFDIETNHFVQTYSHRIQSNPGKDEIVAGLCARPPRATGKQDEMTHVYAVGSTAGVLQGNPAGARDAAVLSQYSGNTGADAVPMEAFLMKIELKTMKVLWTVQVGAVVPGGDKKGVAAGYGCAVTPDGKDVYLTGTVAAGSVATDFSAADDGGAARDTASGVDVFVASYKVKDGTKLFLTQVGSSQGDDAPSRGGGVAADAAGNAIVTGSTRGSLLRERDPDEYRHGKEGQAAADVFVLSLARGTGAHLPPVRDGADAALPAVTAAAPVAVAPAGTSEELTPVTAAAPVATSEELTLTQVSALVGIAVFLAALAAYTLVLRKTNAKKMREVEELVVDPNLHSSRHRGKASHSQQKQRWGLRRQKSMASEFDNLNIAMEVRNSASGGWHGVYDVERIDFCAAPSPGDAPYTDAPCTEEEELQEIEGGLDAFAIGDEMEEMSDEDLIRAYNDAMALDIEPESEDFEFAMQGIGSGAPAGADVPKMT